MNAYENYLKDEEDYEDEDLYGKSEQEKIMLAIFHLLKRLHSRGL